MEIGECIKHYLDASTGIHDLIVDRIYPIKLPQNPTLPALTYQEISGLEHHDIDVAYPRYQFSCWAESYEDVDDLSKEVKSAFKRMKDVMGGSSGKRIIQAVIEGVMDLYESETEIYHKPIDVKIVYVK